MSIFQKSIFKHTLGTEVRDQVTGFKGRIISRAEYLNGCIRYGVQPPIDKDGKIPDAEWVDEQQLEVIVAAPEEPRAVRTGGPQRSDPPRF